MSSPVIAPILELLFNKCLTNGSFPRSLKIGKIVPIHKKVQRMNAVITDPLHYSVHFQKFLKNAFINKCTLILKNIIY